MPVKGENHPTTEQFGKISLPGRLTRRASIDVKLLLPLILLPTPTTTERKPAVVNVQSTINNYQKVSTD